MKTFLQFITESTATQQAARLGLVSDGHGGWTDRSTGEFVAKTEKGRLKFFNKRQKVGGKDPAQSEKEKNLSDPNMEAPPQGQQAPPPEQQEAPPEEQQPAPEQEVQSPDLAAGPPPVEKTKGTLTLAFGRFNPPHAGHLQFFHYVVEKFFSSLILWYQHQVDFSLDLVTLMEQLYNHFLLALLIVQRYPLIADDLRVVD